MDKIDTIIIHCSATHAGRGKAAGGKKKRKPPHPADKRGTTV